MTGIENQTIVTAPIPEGTPPSDPELGLVSRDDLVDNSDHQLRVDPSVRDMGDIVTQIGNDVVASQEMVRYIAALENWACVLDASGEQVSVESQIATELLLGLTTAKAGIGAKDIVPSMEDLASNVRSASQLRVYAERLLEALFRLFKRIGELFGKFIDIITSNVRAIRIDIVAARAQLLRAKGGRIKQQRIDLGRYADFVAVRGQPIINGGELGAALYDVTELYNSITDGHLFAVVDCGRELVRIASSESFPNPAATESRVARAFAMLDHSTLSKLCIRQVGSDTRFQRKDYTTTASKNMIGNKTIFKTAPNDLKNPDGFIVYEFADTRLIGQRGEYQAKDTTFLTIPYAQCESILEQAEKTCQAMETFAKSNIQNRVGETLSDLRKIISRRAKDGTLTGATADIIQGAATAFTDACVNPMRDLNAHLIETLNVSIELVSRSAKAYD